MFRGSSPYTTVLCVVVTVGSPPGTGASSPPVLPADLLRQSHPLSNSRTSTLLRPKGRRTPEPVYRSREVRRHPEGQSLLYSLHSRLHRPSRLLSSPTTVPRPVSHTRTSHPRPNNVLMRLRASHSSYVTAPFHKDCYTLPGLPAIEVPSSPRPSYLKNGTILSSSPRTLESQGKKIPRVDNSEKAPQNRTPTWALQ